MALRETLNNIRSGSIPPNEEAAKFQIIAPILRDLGWNPFGPNVLYEHSVGGGEGGSVDIALQGPRGDLVALIEAKAPSIDLRKHVSQVLRYAHYEGVDICVLTNGLEWWLYLPLEKGAPEKRRFTTLTIKEDPVEQLADDLETFLGEKNLVNGQAQKRAKQVLKASRQAAFLDTELPAVWKTMLDGPDDDLVELVRQRTYEKVNLRPDRKQVAAMLSGSPVPTVVPSDSTVVSTSRSITRIDSSKSRTRKDANKPTPSHSDKPTGIMLWKKHYKVRIWKDIHMHVADALHNEYGPKFIDRLLVYRTTRGRPYASLRQRDLREGRPIPSTDIYLETNFSSKDIQKVAHLLLGFFGHSPSDLKILYD